jgi:hypothetical protein
MIHVDAEQHSMLSAEYARNGYAILPRLVEPEVAAEWEFKHRSLHGRKVQVGSDYQAWWTCQEFPDPSEALDGLAFTDEFVKLVIGITGLNAIDQRRTQVWINRYVPGDRVPIHCDWTGSTQLVLCLQGLLEPEKGGDLIIRDEIVPLRTGDAVLFFARGLPHGVLPIASDKVDSSSFSRVTCVVRFFTPNDP